VCAHRSELNYYTKLMLLKDAHGDPLFLSIVLGLVCAACKANGALCTHKLSMSPDWKPPGKKRREHEEMGRKGRTMD
jgi:hypothetical protein